MSILSPKPIPVDSPRRVPVEDRATALQAGTLPSTFPARARRALYTTMARVEDFFQNIRSEVEGAREKRHWHNGGLQSARHWEAHVMLNGIGTPREVEELARRIKVTPVGKGGEVDIVLSLDRDNPLDAHLGRLIDAVKDHRRHTAHLLQTVQGDAPFIEANRNLAQLFEREREALAPAIRARFRMNREEKS